jgi:hypothetical protein
MKTGSLWLATTIGSKLTKRLTFLPLKSAGGGWWPPWANALGNVEGISTTAPTKSENVNMIATLDFFLENKLSQKQIPV